MRIDKHSRPSSVDALEVCSSITLVSCRFSPSSSTAFVTPALQTDSRPSVSIAELLATGYASFNENYSRMTSDFQWESYFRRRTSWYPSTSFFCLYILFDLDCFRGTPTFDPALGGFVAPIVTGYQSDFDWKCFACNATNEDNDDQCEEADGEGNVESEEFCDDSDEKPTRRSAMRCASVSCFISLFHTCRSGPFAC